MSSFQRCQRVFTVVAALKRCVMHKILLLYALHTITVESSNRTDVQIYMHTYILKVGMIDCLVLSYLLGSFAYSLFLFVWGSPQL